MNTHAPSPTIARSQTAPCPRPVRGLGLTPVHGLLTGEMVTGDESLIPAATVIDYRTRLQVIRLPLARRGHYLALDADCDDELLPLSNRITHLGRGRMAEIRIEDIRVSRDHAILVTHGDHLRLLDNRSSAGSFVNGYLVSATTLSDGDVVQLGPVELRYRWIEPAGLGR